MMIAVALRTLLRSVQKDFYSAVIFFFHLSEKNMAHRRSESPIDWVSKSYNIFL